MKQAIAMRETVRRAAPEGRATERERSLATMLSMRIVHFFLLLRRSSSTVQPSELVLSRLEWRVMTQLDGAKPLSLTRLAARLMLDRGQLSRAVKGMVGQGLLTRSRKPGGPEIEINLSREGLGIRSAMIDQAGVRDRFLIEGLEPADLAVAFRVIEHMTARAEMLAQEQEAASGD